MTNHLNNHDSNHGGDDAAGGNGRAGNGRDGDLARSEAVELEAKIVAWVAGELPEFDRAELERLVAARPELAKFRERMELVRDLVTDAVRADAEPLRMSAERREKLLRTLGSTGEVLPLREQVVVLPPRTPWWRGRNRYQYFGVGGLLAGAAAAMALLFFQVPVYEERAEVQFARPDPVVVMQQSVADTSIRSNDGSRPVAVRRAGEEKFREVNLVAGESRVAMPQSKRKAEADIATPLAQVETVSEPQFATVRLTAPSLSAPAAPTVAANGAAQVITMPRAQLRLLDERALAENSFLPQGPTAPLTLSGTQAAVGFAPSDLGATQARQVQVKSEPFAGAFDLASAPVPAETRIGQSPTAALPTGAPVPLGDALMRQETAAAQGILAKDASAGMREGAAPATSAMAPAGTVVLDGRASATGGAILGTGQSGVALAPLPAAPAADVGELRLDAFTVATDKDTQARAVEAKAKAEATKKAEAERARAIERDDAPAVRRPREVKPAVPEEAAAAREPFSTFSLHVSDVSFRLAREAVAAMARGGNVTAPAIRPEEFYNAFRYGDPLPGTDEKIGARIEQAAHPVLQQRNLVRIALRVAATGRTAAQPLRLTVLLDTSGSMEREDRATAVRRALRELAALLGPADRVTLVGFARTPRLLAEAVPGDRAGTLVDLAARTPAEGGTNFEAALRLGGELARRHRLEGAQNRVVLLTDGAANLGAAEPAQLAAQVAAWRREGIAFDACGVGLEGLDDDVLEALARSGDGRYAVLGGGGEAEAKEFAQRLAGALRPAAENVKVQVRFNAARVGRYRLIGFEQHRLATEDFRNDAVDAAELAAEENAVALYQVEVLPQGAGELGEVFVRFRDAATGQMVERAWPIAHEPAAPAFARATPSLQLAGVAALLADKLRETPLAQQFTLAELAGPVAAVRTHYAREPRVQELATMYDQLRRIIRE